MYRHPETKDEEYPRTPRERLHHSLRLLSQVFPGRTVKATDYEIPTVSWDGAGSERGGSAEHIKYDKILFLPAEKDAVAISVGDASERFSHRLGMILKDRYNAPYIYDDYSTLLLQRLPQDSADTIVEHYLENVAGNDDSEKESNFSWAMHKLLGNGTSCFSKLPLFAYDSWDGFFVKSRRFEPQTRLLERVDSLGSAESIAQAIVKYTQGKGSETAFANFTRHENEFSYDRSLSENTVEDILKRLK
ncbi:MAG: hypothetical protein AABX05_00670 [Nanoarchaeota archaeon]